MTDKAGHPLCPLSIGDIRDALIEASVGDLLPDK